MGGRGHPHGSANWARLKLGSHGNRVRLPPPKNWTALALDEVAFTYPGKEQAAVSGISLENSGAGRSYGFRRHVRRREKARWWI
jgi:hypothetical protein